MSEIQIISMMFWGLINVEHYMLVTRITSNVHKDNIYIDMQAGRNLPKLLVADN